MGMSFIVYGFFIENFQVGTSLVPYQNIQISYSKCRSTFINKRNYLLIQFIQKNYGTSYKEGKFYHVCLENKEEMIINERIRFHRNLAFGFKLFNTEGHNFFPGSRTVINYYGSRFSSFR